MISQKVSFHSCRRLFLYHQRPFHVKPESIVIVSAVRTPWGRYQGQLSSVTASQLSKATVEAAVKQSAVPVEEIKQVYVAETPSITKDETEVNINNTFLKKAIFSTVKAKYEIVIKSILMGLEDLKALKVDVVVVGGSESSTTNKSLEISMKDKEMLNFHLHKNTESYKNNSMERFKKAQMEGLFDEELVPVQVLQQSDKRKKYQEITQDEVVTVNLNVPGEFINYSDGAAALVLTTFAKAEELNLTPLAFIKDFEYRNNISADLSSIKTSIEQLLFKYNIYADNLQHWEIDDCKPHLISSIKKHFNLNVDLINPNGGCLIFGKSLAASLPRMLTHMTHSLKSSQYGCVVSNNSNESITILLEKFPLPFSSGGLPVLTIFTKNPCPMCDMLVEELEMHFSGEYELAKVYIDTKENVRFLRLYRHDIPVVFLNGQFLCMHRLKISLLRRKLDLLKK